MLDRQLQAIADEPGWSRALSDLVVDVGELLDLLGLTHTDLGVDVDSAFPLRVPRGFVARMKYGDANDPLLRQVLPLAAEREPAVGFVQDPLQEDEAVLAPAVIQKYAGRVLLIAAGECAVHCRYCFRRNFPYGQHRLRVSAESLGAIRADHTISEVIASGGDPLMLTDRHWERLLDELESIAHVRRLRIHTRLPVVIPSRLTLRLIDRLAASRLQVVVVVHVNHPNEIGAELAQGTGELVRRGVTVLNQAVLLAGVNDSADVLVQLSEALFAAQILPYYLHLLDPVAGTRHLQVEDQRACALHAEIRDCLPGYLVPRLAREVPGQTAKQWLA